MLPIPPRTTAKRSASMSRAGYALPLRTRRNQAIERITRYRSGEKGELPRRAPSEAMSEIMTFYVICR